MFSGKTEELLRLLRRASIGGRSVLLIRPLVDTRSPVEVAESRSGTSYACISVATAEDILEAVAASPCEVVAIDEAEMFGDSLAHVANRLATDGYEVIISGLDTDFAGRPFGAMPTLLALADTVTKLTAICTFPGCGNDATRTQRLVDNQPAAIDDPADRDRRHRGCTCARQIRGSLPDPPSSRSAAQQRECPGRGRAPATERAPVAARQLVAGRPR